MEIESIKTELRNYIRENFTVALDDPDFSDSVHLYDYGYVDSFGAVRIKMFMQSKFFVQFSQKDMTSFPLNSVDQMADFILRRNKGEI